MAVEGYIPGFSIVTITALVDAVNPCAIGVLIVLLSILISKKLGRKKMIILGILYILSVFVVYFLSGLGLLTFFSSLPLLITEYISIGVSLLVIGAGILEIKDFFYYAKGISLTIPYRISKMIPKFGRNTKYIGVIFLGAFVSAVELPCTGAPYLAIITLLSQDFNGIGLLLLLWYNLLFVSPLLIILLLVISGVHLSRIKQWKEMNKAYMRLAIGIILVLLGWLLILIANGNINLA